MLITIQNSHFHRGDTLEEKTLSDLGNKNEAPDHCFQVELLLAPELIFLIEVWFRN